MATEQPGIPTPPAWSVMMVLLLVAAGLAVVIGFGSLSDAMLGVGALMMACLLTIVARMAQAATQHKELLRAMHAFTDSRKTGIAAGEVQTSGR